MRTWSLTVTGLGGKQKKESLTQRPHCRWQLHSKPLKSPRKTHERVDHHYRRWFHMICLTMSCVLEASRQNNNKEEKKYLLSLSLQSKYPFLTVPVSFNPKILPPDKRLCTDFSKLQMFSAFYPNTEWVNYYHCNSYTRLTEFESFLC